MAMCLEDGRGWRQHGGRGVASQATLGSGHFWGSLQVRDGKPTDVCFLLTNVVPLIVSILKIVRCHVRFRCGVFSSVYNSRP